MLHFIVKAALSGLIIAIVSSVARRYPGFGALIASLPLISILGIIWLWRDTGDIPKIAAHSQATFWFVIPSLPMFLAFPWALRAGVPFWPALLGSCLLTIGLYLLTMAILPRFGINL